MTAEWLESQLSIQNMKDRSRYANILKALIAKRNSGVVTFNTWGVYDKNEGSDHEYRYIWLKSKSQKSGIFIKKYFEK